MDELGPTLIKVLEAAHQGGFTVSSGFAREYASEVATCASLGFISNRPGTYHRPRFWFITSAGLRHLEKEQSK